MSNFRTILTSAALASLLTTSLLVTLATVPETVSAYTVHDPIYINGDADFTSENGVTGGSGTESDPYIIEGWEIDATTAYGIDISWAKAHFVIRDCYVHNGYDDYSHGIHLFRCVNGTVTGNTCSNTYCGIYLYMSSSISLTSNDCSSNNYSGINIALSSNNALTSNDCSSNNQRGILLSSSSNNTLDGNNCSNNRNGIQLITSSYSSSNDNTLRGNNCSSNTVDGIYLDSSSKNNTLSINDCSSNSQRGICLRSSSNNTLSGNDCILNDNHGIYLHTSSNNNTLDGNNCSLNALYGIQLTSSSNNTLRNNTCSNNDLGIYLYTSSNNNTLRDNNCSNNYDGIGLDSSNNNSLSRNNCSWNNNNGIYLYSSSNNNAVNGNNCSRNYGGMYLFSSDNNALGNNTCSSNADYGLFLSGSDDNTLSDNNCSNNEDGIYVSWALANILIYNSISSNLYGVYIYYSTETTVYHNAFFDNTAGHALDDSGSENHWNASYPIGGNYWDNYTGVDEYSGPDQNQLGPDGIGDTPYKIDDGNYDYYPLMEPPNRPPTASFIASPATGYLNTVFSVDASTSSDAEDDISELEVRWDWESDEVWDTSWSILKTATHQYSAEGTYTIMLEVRDTEGLTDSTTRQVAVVPDDVPPVADAGPDQMAYEDTLVTFNGSDSSDNIGIVNYTWTFVDGGEKELYGIGPAYTFEDPGEYTVTLDVADAADNHDTDTVLITVLDVNDPPVADAGSDQTVTVGEAVIFNGSGSSDDVGIENYTWTFIYDEEERELHGVGPKFTFDIAGTYVVTLTVEDAEGGTDTDTVTITVEEEQEEEQEDGDDKSFLESYGLPIGIIVVLAIVALILFLVLKNRKGGSTAAVAEEPTSTDAQEAEGAD